MRRDGGRLVSVVIPARDAASSIRSVVSAVMAQQRPGVTIEVIVVDDHSADATAAEAARAGAWVLAVPPHVPGANPAAARNRGAGAASGDPLVFLDADCVPRAGWMDALLAAHDRGAVVVGGALAAPRGLPLTARCDYYCGSYHVHPARAAGPVPNHPPANLSVRSAAFRSTAGFTEAHPVADGHEELAWQGALRAAGGRIEFEPRAVVEHHNRPGVGNLLRRNYRWGYSAIESKAATGAARLAWLYRHPRLLLAAGIPFALAHTAYTLACWARAGVAEPLAMAPMVLGARLAYAVGMMEGGLDWVRRSDTPRRSRPRWR
ncbi:MAG TPA: glycosyltransferase [Gemmatimonadaceae bacterium]|nr:glycosyltransferase [Gemmatimonadaceae bacterium]